MSLCFLFIGLTITIMLEAVHLAASMYIPTSFIIKLEICVHFFKCLLCTSFTALCYWENLVGRIDHSSFIITLFESFFVVHAAEKL